MRRLVDDLLDLARVNSGKVRLDLEEIDLRQILVVAADAAQVFMEEPRHQLTTSWPDDAIRVNADRARMGIPVAAQARVFDMFEQVGEHLKQSQGGLGIGLSLVQKLVSLRGGHVEAFSQGANRGSTFTVYLPLLEGAACRDCVAPAHSRGAH